MDPIHPIVVLKELIRTLEDGEEGFGEAAKATDTPDLRTVLEFYARQRAEFGTQLHQAASAYGDSAYEEGSTLAGALHRGWIDLRAAISAKDPAAILSECERGEDHAVAHYQKALEEDLPPDLRKLIESQAVEIRAAHDKVKHLRDLAKAT